MCKLQSKLGLIEPSQCSSDRGAKPRKDGRDCECDRNSTHRQKNCGTMIDQTGTKKKATVKAGEVFIVIETLIVNDSKMYKLKSGTYIITNLSYTEII